MTLLRSLIILSVLIGCKKTIKETEVFAVSDSEIMELLDPDENFIEKKQASRKKVDSVSNTIVEFNDLNGDGVRDTAFIKSNSKSLVSVVKFSCFSDSILTKNSKNIKLTDLGDLNGDNKHELMLMSEADEGCWDEIRLFSFKDKWEKKYQGLTYQCTEHANYKFTQVDEKTVRLITFGIQSDSFDTVVGDTLENIIPNAENSHIIVW